MRARTKSSKKSLKEVNIYPFDSKTIFTLQAEEAFDAKAIFWDSEKFIVVTLFAFYLDDLSSDPTDVQSNLLYSCNYNKIMRKSQVYIYYRVKINFSCFTVVDVTPVTEYTPSGYQSLLLTNLQKLEESEKGCENRMKKLF